MPSLAANALTTLADVKESLGLSSGDSSKNNLINRKINQVSQQLENYCERVFHAADYTEYYTGTLIDQLVLNQRPVNSLTTLSYRTSAANLTDFIDIDSSYYFLDSTSGIVNMTFAAYGRWQRWKVVYNAGYTTIPNDLAEAANILACYFVNNPDGFDIGKMRITEGQRSIQYQRQALTFKSILEQLGLDQTIDQYANWPLRSE
jgi:hypothetical protein